MTFPNSRQEKVIQHTGKPLVVVAGPGTGKTSTIVERMARLLKEDSQREVSFITFTRASRRDTEGKIISRVAKEDFEGSDYDFPRVSTLHTYAKSVVHKYAQTIDRSNAFSVLVSEKGELDLILTELILDLDLDVKLSDLRVALNAYRCTELWPESFEIDVDTKQQILDHYETMLSFYNTFDIEGLVNAATKILSSGDIKFPAILLQVDEFQDLNPLDQRFIKLISSNEASQVVVVGDDAQSIYGMRHANPQGLNDLWTSSEWENVVFKDCHRLPPQILRATQALIRDCNYLGGKINLPEDNGDKITALSCTTRKIQIEIVAKIIIDTMNTEENIAYNDFLVLCPTRNHVSSVARVFEEYEIPVRIKEKKTIPDDHWRLLLLLRILCFEDSLALRQWLPILGLTANIILKIRLEAMESDVSLYEHCESSCNDKIGGFFGELEKLRKSVKEAENFKRKLLNFPNLQIDLKLFPDIGVTFEMVEGESFNPKSIVEAIFERFGIYETEETTSDEKKVLVTTFHSAKGLESKCVFVMWVNKTFMPGKSENPEEQRRVLYVALTRAKEDLIITFQDEFDANLNKRTSGMSPFLNVIYGHLNIRRVNKESLKHYKSK